MSLVQKTVKATTSGSNEYVAVDFPDRTLIQQINIAGSGGAFNATIYNREIVGPAIPVASMMEDVDSGDVKVAMESAHNYVVGDSIVVASSSVVGYNTTHVVAEVFDRYTWLSDQTYTADDNNSSATATLTVPTAERPAYEVLVTTAAGSGVVRDLTSHVFVSEQKDLVSNNRPQARLYVLLSAADSYVISIRGEQSNP